jgi:hypothetical protein
VIEITAGVESLLLPPAVFRVDEAFELWRERLLLLQGFELVDPGDRCRGHLSPVHEAMKRRYWHG